METPIKGKDRVLMFRLLQEKDKKNATRLALQTTHTIKESSKAETTATKDGSIASAGALETSIDIEALGSDTLVNDMLHYAVKNQLEIECWEIDFTKPGKKNDTFISQYGSGYLSDWETPAAVDGDATIKTTLTINGKLVKGEATVSKEDQKTVHNFFRDTLAGAPNVDPLPDYDPDAKEPAKADEAKADDNQLEREGE